MPLTFSGLNVGHGFRLAAGLSGGVPGRRPIGVPTRFGADLRRATPGGNSAARREPCPPSPLAERKGDWAPVPAAPGLIPALVQIYGLIAECRGLEPRQMRGNPGLASKEELRDPCSSGRSMRRQGEP